MRGVDPFPELWERRTTIAIDEIEADLLSLPDLVKAKKTQRARDWPMLQRLIEAHWFQNRSTPTPERIDFWLRECRTPEILLDLTHLFPAEATASDIGDSFSPHRLLKPYGLPVRSILPREHTALDELIRRGQPPPICQ